MQIKNLNKGCLSRGFTRGVDCDSSSRQDNTCPIIDEGISYRSSSWYGISVIDCVSMRNSRA